MDLTPDQIHQLNQLGIETKNNPKKSIPTKNTIQKPASPTNNLTTTPTTSNSHKSNNIFPILSISGLTLLSFSSLILFKTKDQPTQNNSTSNTTLPTTYISPTQVPKSIQHYLLASQQYFTQASQNQNVEDLNQAIVSATNAIKEFPNDYRGFYQRGRIYQSILSSQPQLFSQVISDLSQAQKLNPTNAEITRSLASAYAQNGDAQNTINYLSQTISLDPTTAQNFYDLALIQQQVGYLPQAIETYKQLITIISDPTQKTQIESEKLSLEKLIAQNPNQNLTQTSQTISPIPTINLPSSLDSPTIQASTSTGLIVAAPEELNQVQVTNLTTSNSLSGSDILPAGQSQISISNNQITSTSQVYISVIKGGKNQNIQIISKSNGSFTAGLDSSISEDIEFNWWIIN